MDVLNIKIGSTVQFKESSELSKTLLGLLVSGGDEGVDVSPVVQLLLHLQAAQLDYVVSDSSV